jgi:sugar/nucleoside kinase (ribokinase family)
VAVGLSRFGISTAVLGKIGDDESGEKILANLQNEGVSREYLQVEKKGESGFSVILSASSGERTVLFASGANDLFRDFDESILIDFDGICLQHLSGCSRNVFIKVREFFLQKPHKFFSWNPGRESLEQGALAFSDVLPMVDVILINKEEGELFTGESKIEDICHALYSAGAQKNIIITDGMKGATGFDGKQLYFCSVLNDMERVDTLGAGDSFLTGVVGSIYTGKSLPDALKLGTINAAHVVAKCGAQTGLQKATDLEKHISRIHIDTKSFSLL